MISSYNNIRLFFIKESVGNIIIINIQKHHHCIADKIIFLFFTVFYEDSTMIISQNIHQIFIIKMEKKQTFFMLYSR